MALFQRLAGVIANFFQVGGPAGAGLNQNAGALETRNAANTAFAIHRGATPVGDNDLTTKAYVDTIFKPIPVSLQFNGGSALPANTATEQYYVVTTSGVNATIGQVLWDDGSGSGTVTVLATKTGNEIVTTATFSGGTITLQTNQNYVWSGSAWVNISPSVAGVISCIDFALATAATTSSTTQIPANAIVLSCELKVTTPYTAGATVSIGQTGSLSLLQATSDNSPTLANEYLAPQRTGWGASATAVVATIGGAPSAGAATVTVTYSSPNT